MKNRNLKRKILQEFDRLISLSCPNRTIPQNFKDLHVDILKKYYNAADVSIDYHRKRVALDIVMDDASYDPKGLNLHLPTLHANLFFKNLTDFLKSCIEKDNGSLTFYASLLRSYSNTDAKLSVT